MAGDLDFSKLTTSDNFYREVDKLVKTHSMKYIDAVVYFCEKNNIEIEVVASMIRSNGRIKSHIQCEGEELNFLPRTAKLPV